MEEILVNGSTAYMAAGKQGLQIFVISDPEAPKQIGFYNDPSIIDYASFVDVNGSYAYVADDRLMYIFDIVNPANPLLASTYDAGSYHCSFVVEDTYAYILGDGFQVVDISNPAMPVKAGFYSGVCGNALVKSGNLVYMATDTSLQVMDVSIPGAPVIKGVCKIGGTPVDVAIKEGGIVVLLRFGGLRILEEG